MRSVVVVNLTLLFIAFVWGFGFVPQRLGMDFMGPNAFNALRFACGALTLLPLLFFIQSIGWRDVRPDATLSLGLVLGVLLFGGAAFQQMSIQYTKLANVAFITGLYVIIVPLIAYFLGYRYKLVVWIGGVLAIVGMYLMNDLSNEISLKGDILALIGAVFWAIHLLVLSEKAGNHKQLLLAFYQFAFCALFSLVLALAIEPAGVPTDMASLTWPLVNGVLVVGIAYTLQVWVMEHAEPFLASLILALEAVFGALFGYFVFDEVLFIWGLIGAGLMLFGCLLAQLPGTQSKSSDSAS
ncbi:MAG: DMT family transporter [Pseudomonadota bacterium]